MLDKIIRSKKAAASQGRACGLSKFTIRDLRHRLWSRARDLSEFTHPSAILAHNRPRDATGHCGGTPNSDSAWFAGNMRCTSRFAGVLPGRGRFGKFRGENCQHGCFQFACLDIEHAPDHVVVHAVVAVRDIIPRAGDLVSGQLRMPLAQIFGQAFHGFALDFHQPLRQHLFAPVTAKFLPSHGIAQLDGLVANLDDLPQCQIGVMRAHTQETTRL